jgi:hypothetical protein
LALSAAALVAAAIWFLLPAPKATVAAKIHIPANNQAILGQNAILGKESTQRHAALVKSRLVLNAALKNEKVVNADPAFLHDRDTLSWLEQEIKVDFPSGPEIMRVSMVGDKTEELVILVDAVVDAYMKEFQSSQSLALKQRIETLEKFLRIHKERVQRLQQHFIPTAAASIDVAASKSPRTANGGGCRDAGHDFRAKRGQSRRHDLGDQDGQGARDC